MKSLKKIGELADRFECKLQAYATSEVDSTMVTLYVRPIVNDAIGKANIPAKLNSILTSAANKGLSGDVIIGGQYFITNARKVGGRWVIDPNTTSFPLVITGDLTNDAGIKSQFVNIVNSLKSSIISSLNTKFNQSNLEGDTITDHKTEVSDFNGGI